MKKLLLVLFMAQPLAAVNFGFFHNPKDPAYFKPSPINTYTNFLKKHVSNPYARMSIFMVGFAICATDNPVRKKLLSGIHTVEQHIFKANDVTNKAYRLEKNVRTWLNSLKSVA